MNGIAVLEDDGRAPGGGRDFNDHDTGTKVTAAIVNRKFAARFFGGKSPLGRRIGFGGGPKTKLDIEIVRV
jgi:hypothetical protein